MNHEQEEAIENCVLMIHSSHKSVQLEGLIGIRNFFLPNNDNALIQKILDTQIAPKLLEFMIREDESQLQFESSWCILNICSRDDQFVDYIIELGGLDIIIYLFDSENEEFVDHAIWTMANIAGSRVIYRDMCLERGCMEKLIQILEKFSTSDSIIKSAVHSISNLLCGQPLPDEKVTSSALPIFYKHISDVHSEETLTDALWGICYVAEHTMEEIVAQGCIPFVMYYLNGATSHNLLKPLLRILGKLIAETEPQFSYQTKEVVKDPRFLPRIFELATEQSIQIKKEAFWIISNVIAEDPHQTQILIENDDYINILKNAISTEESFVATEAAWVICNMIEQGTSQQIDCIIKTHHLLNSLAFVLATIDDDDLKAAVLEVVHRILQTEDDYVPEIKDAGFVIIIRNLVENDEFAKEAKRILEYFSSEKTQDERSFKKGMTTFSGFS